MPETIYYDGGCGFCHRAIKFVAKRDTTGRFVFAPRHGDYARDKLGEACITELPESIVVQRADGQLLFRSDATAYMLMKLGGGWGLFGKTLSLIPRPIRDLGYRGIARVRKRLSDRPTDVCPVVPEQLKDRFRR